MKNKIKIAIIGCGGIARNAHMKQYQKLVHDFEIVAACDIITEKAEKFAGQVKNLIAEEEKELRRAVFRLELIIRKEQTENAAKQFEEVKKVLKEHFGTKWVGGN